MSGQSLTTSRDARGAAAALPEPCVLLKLGEIVLKGKNRQQFERILHGNIRAALRDTGVPVDMRQREGVILLRVADGESRGPDGWTAAVGRVAERVRDVPGIVTVAQPLRVAKTPEAVVAAAVALTAKKAGTFAVRSRGPMRTLRPLGPTPPSGRSPSLSATSGICWTCIDQTVY